MSQLPAITGDSHVAWTVSSTAYLRNLEAEDLERECIAIHHQNAPKRNESGGTTLSVKCPALIVSLYYDPSEIADRVAAILNAHWDSFGEPEVHVWQPIETAPKDGTYILSFYGSIPLVIQWSNACNGWCCSTGPYHPLPLTHWMPLPNLPEKGEG